VAKLPPVSTVSTTPAANFATSFTNVVEFATGVNDTAGKFAASVNDTGINDTGGKVATGVNDTGGKQWN
jgi:hypothetical protein